MFVKSNDGHHARVVTRNNAVFPSNSHLVGLHGVCFYMQLPLSGGYSAIVDPEDYPELIKFKWTADVRKTGVYAKRFIDRTVDGKRVRKQVYLHRYILGIDDPKIKVDHKNRQTLDCRRNNLRSCSQSQNAWNSRRDNPLGFKGICKRPSGRYGAYISPYGKNTCVGTFETAELAARAYDKAAIYFYGEFANLNFPDSINDYEANPYDPNRKTDNKSVMPNHRKGKLRCMVCWEKWFDLWFPERDSRYKKWNHVKPIAKTGGEAIICECQNCGHTYKTVSKVASRAYDLVHTELKSFENRFSELKKELETI
jgi:hypothetical protein